MSHRCSVNTLQRLRLRVPVLLSRHLTIYSSCGISTLTSRILPTPDCSSESTEPTTGTQHSTLFHGTRTTGSESNTNIANWSPLTASSPSPSSLSIQPSPHFCASHATATFFHTLSSSNATLRRPNRNSTHHRAHIVIIDRAIMATQVRHHAGHGHHHHHHHHDNTFLTSTDKNDAGVRITRIGLYVNLGMAIGKGVGGYVFHSQGIHPVK
jgi:hypothetical protein